MTRPDAVRGGPAALRAARVAGGLTQEQLAERAGVSVRTIRGLESGQVRAPHRHSLKALAGALDLSPAQGEVFVASWSAARSAKTFTELVDAGFDVEQLLAQEAERAEVGYQDLAVTEKLIVGPDRRGLWNENVIVMQALRDGVDRRLVLWGQDPIQDVGLVRMDRLQNCTGADARPFPDLNLVAFELFLGRALERHETQMLSYRFDITAAYLDDAELAERGIASTPTTYAVHGFRRTIQTYVLQIEFDGCPPPDRLWQVIGPDHDRHRIRPLELNAFNSAHITCQNLEPGVHGIEWAWD